MAQQLEMSVLRGAQAGLSRGPVRLYRNNVGMGWQGSSRRVGAEDLADCRAALRPGDLILRAPRPLHAGLDVGSGDLIGWKSQVVTPAMVGRTVAVFASLEAKRPRGGRIEPAQRTWRQLVTRAGGIAGVFRSTEEARAILESPLGCYHESTLTETP
jgi:hypothetical protein